MGPFIFSSFIIRAGANRSKNKIFRVVRDSLEAPLSAASLVAIDKATNALDAYTITGEDGKFNLELKAQKNTKYK